jgi:hypothetical protein
MSTSTSRCGQEGRAAAVSEALVLTEAARRLSPSGHKASGTARSEHALNQLPQFSAIQGT